MKYIYMQKIHMKQNLINKREKVRFNVHDDPKAFIEYSNDMQHVYKILTNTIQERNVEN